MLVTASTVKDSPDNVRFFVEANLAAGVDHMVVFLDAPRDPGQREVAEELADHPAVTCLPTDRGGWWAGDRPGNLNVRQRINVNWVREVLAPLPWADWLFHVDGDEVVHADRQVLDAIGEDVPAVWLQPWEAVSELEPPARPTRFKRLLDADELNLLHVLGAIEAPTNQAYFHGHLLGKTGIRPGSGLGLTLHEAVDRADGRRHEASADPGLRVLHYDAISGAEFVRKWSALAQAGHARYRPTRAPTARALKTLISRDLPTEVRERYLRRVYELTTADDVVLLADLGLLEDVDPLRGGHHPAPLDDAARAELAARVDRLREGPKRDYFVADAAKDHRLAGTTGPGTGGRLRGRLKRLAGG